MAVEGAVCAGVEEGGGTGEGDEVCMGLDVADGVDELEGEKLKGHLGGRANVERRGRAALLLYAAK